ncbi:N/A [soil metagenome]
MSTGAGTDVATTSPTLARVVLDRSGVTDAIALIDRDQARTYDDLAAAVVDRIDELALDTRSLVVLGGSRSLEYVVTYLALLSDGHVPLLAGDHADRLSTTWSANAMVHVDGDHVDVRHLPMASRPDLHPDLGLLMSTSGSLGSPKLVRLSHRNLVSNAEAIATALDLRSTDRGITSLPLHYCYGLSVLHSHLVVGGGVVLTDASVVDPCFWAALANHRVTNVAGVPHTFDLLDQLGPDLLQAPSLRLITQAGGRLAPERVREWNERANSWGADFVVMYGQTEATARMAVLPPDVATRRPGAVGRAVPGGELFLRAVDGAAPDTGELVYRGPNVMMGYATNPGHLAVGPELDELATGDLARHHPDDDVFEIVGRRARFVKPFGLRIDLDALEGELAAALKLTDVAVAGDDDRIAIFAPGAEPAAVAGNARRLTTLPARCISVDVELPVPRTSSEKVDYRAIADRVGPQIDPGVDPASDATVERVPTTDAATDAATAVATVLGRRVAKVGYNDTFVSLGGDSLRYI